MRGVWWTTERIEMKTSLIIIIASTILTACSGSGSSGSATLPSDFPSGDGNTPDQNNAEPGYYGFNSADSIVTKALPPFVIGEEFIVENELAVIITDINTRSGDYMIYQPSCVEGFLTHHYNAVLLKGNHGAPSRIQISVSSNTVTISEYAESLANTGHVVKSTETNTGECNAGEFFSPISQWILFQNGRSVVFKDLDNNLYLGFRNQIVDKSDLLFKKFKIFHHQAQGAISITNRLSVWSWPPEGIIFEDNSSNLADTSFGFSSPDTTVKGFASNWKNSVYRIKNNSNSTTFAQIWNNQVSTVPMIGITAILSGKIVSIHNSVFRNCEASDVYTLSGEQVCDSVGSGGLSFYFEK